ncbi:MAG: hypothetical protein GX448_13050 [Planctomycetes bacterium]|nr:hypothetical protein [Planctomycetota bacterium]
MGKKSIMCLSCFLVLGAAHATLGDLVGHWTFDEGGGTVVFDESGNGNDGTITGNPTWIKGVIGKALEFHGLGSAVGGGDSINCGNGASLNIASRISIAMWIMPGADGPEAKGTETAPMCKALSSANPSWSWQVRYGWGSSKPFMAFTFNTSPRAWAYVNKNLERYEWCHIACSHDGATLKCYLNGEQTDSTAMGAITISPTPVLIGSDGWGSDWIGGIDDVRVYNQGLTAEEIAAVMAGTPKQLAQAPAPEDQATDVPTDTSLIWTAGQFAATHDVYLGKVFDDVNDASRSDPKGVLVSQDQGDIQYKPQGGLEYGKTYYWRVDEVNAAPDSTIFKGLVWSFTVEPYAYPISNVTAKASSTQAGMNVQNIVNGSGLNDLDQHSTEATQMWTSTNAKPHWVQFEFDKAYKLYEMWVWNSNQLVESLIGMGAKDVRIECSVDGQTWTNLENVPQFGRGDGTPTYTANTKVDFGGAMAKFVKLSIDSNWGGMVAQVGLSEVRFFYVPLQAFLPDPVDGAADVSVEGTLSWRPGREATSHKVYIGTDSAAVANGTASSQTVSESRLAPAGLLLGTKYFWRVDEVGTAETYAGDVWSLTTEAFAVVDDFEGYTDDIEAEATIWHAWVDGLTDGKSGSQVGYDEAPFAERTIVHGGRQSMPLRYDNKSFTFSEASLSFDPVQDWTAHGIKTLSISFAGAQGNSGQLYVKINGVKVAYDGSQANVAGADWQVWKIDLSKVSGVNKVRTLAVGIEGAGAKGILYVDDIQLRP